MSIKELKEALTKIKTACDLEYSKPLTESEIKMKNALLTETGVDLAIKDILSRSNTKLAKKDFLFMISRLFHSDVDKTHYNNLMNQLDKLLPE